MVVAFLPAGSPLSSKLQHLCSGHEESRVPLRHSLQTWARPRVRPRTRASRVPCEAKWVKSSATVHVEAPAKEAYECYKDIQEMPKWSPWLTEVRVDAQDRMLSEWVLFSRGIEISWKARITVDSSGDEIAWRSVSGLTNRGSVRFIEAVGGRNPKSSVTLTLEFDVPDFLARAFDDNFIGRFVRETLLADLKRFRAAVLTRHRQRRMHSSASSNCGGQ